MVATIAMKYFEVNKSTFLQCFGIGLHHTCQTWQGESGLHWQLWVAGGTCHQPLPAKGNNHRSCFAWKLKVVHLTGLSVVRRKKKSVRFWCYSVMKRKLLLISRLIKPIIRENDDWNSPDVIC